MSRLAHALLAALFLAAPASASTVERNFSYFTIGGSTLAEIEEELNRRGPMVGTTERRHPGATRMQFATRVSYGENDGRCGVIDATVTLNANMILPRWRVAGDAGMETRIIWDTLASDIRRHEESHVVIARNYAREIETAVKAVRNERDCEAAEARVETIRTNLLRQHDQEQIDFDRIEAVNFERRMLRLLDYRLERMENGRLPTPGDGD